MHSLCHVSTLQDGGVMMRCVFSRHTLGPLIKVKQHTKPKGIWISLPIRRAPSWQQDIHLRMDFSGGNAPCHKVETVSERFHKHANEFSLMQRPVQSPDPNSTEHLWDEMQQAIGSRVPLPTNSTHLCVESAWASIHVEPFSESMPRPTKYFESTPNSLYTCISDAHICNSHIYHFSNS